MTDRKSMSSRLFVPGVLCLLLFTPYPSLLSAGGMPNFTLFNSQVLEQPYSAQSGDFNEDGHLDVATSNMFRNESYITILIGNGQGEFLLMSILPVSGTYIRDIVLADVNGDEHLDICAVCMLSSNVSVFLGNGQGHFSAEAVYEIGQFPEYITAGDFNGDDYTDLVISHWSSGEICVMLNDGSGGFESGCVYDVGGGTKEIDVGDFNEDDNLDIAVATMAFNEVIILFGDGNGDFPSESAVYVDYDVYVVRSGYIDQDEHLDIAVGTKHTFAVLLGDGSGGFTKSYEVWIFDPHAIRVADFNEDGFNDAAISMTQQDLFEVYVGTGEGGFEQETFSLEIENAPRSLGIGDFNEDGHLDLVSANEGSDNLSFLMNQVDLLIVETREARTLYTQGDRAEFTFTVTNPQDTTVYATLWYTLEKGSNQELINPRFLGGDPNPLQLSFPPGEEIEHTVNFRLPSNIDIGLYHFCVNAGHYGRFQGGNLTPSEYGTGVCSPALWNSIVWSSGTFPIRVLGRTVNGQQENNRLPR